MTALSKNFKELLTETLNANIVLIGRITYEDIDSIPNPELRIRVLNLKQAYDGLIIHVTGEKK